MLFSKDEEGRDDRDLDSREHCFIDSIHSDFCLPESDVSGDESIHRVGSLHIFSYRLDDRALIWGMYMRKCEPKSFLLFFELPERDAIREASLRIGLEDIFGDRTDLFIGLRERPFPLFPFETRELRRALSYVFRDTSKLCHREVYLISGTILDLHILSLDESDPLLEDLDIATDPMLSMDDEISLGNM